MGHRSRYIVRGAGRGAVAVAVLSSLAGCDRSEPLALPDGCYYADDGAPILKVQGEEGLILTPTPGRDLSGTIPTAVRRVHISPRVGGDGAFAEVTPGILLMDYQHAVVASGQPMGRFTIDAHPTRPAILIPVTAYGEMPVRLGRPC